MYGNDVVLLHVITIIICFPCVGVVSRFAGGGSASGAPVSGYIDGTGTTAKFQVPAAIKVDSAGNFYVADFSNDLIRQISPAGL